jgi:hypothetical protein
MFQMPRIGAPGEALNGAECRLLRAALCLERRHVAGIDSAMWPGEEPATLAQVTSWERSKGRGYPERIAALLQRLSEGVDRLALHVVGTADVQDGRRTISRPGRDEAREELRPYLGDVQLEEGDLRVGRSRAGFTGQANDLWDVLIDAAMVRAAMRFPAGVRVGPRADQGATPEGRA